MRIQLSDHFTYKKLLRFVFPSIVMMVFISIYGVVDGLFVSNFVGKIPYTAINFIMPFIFLLGGMGFMVGTGGTALVSKVLGEGDREKANRYFSMMVYFTICLGVTFSVIGFVFLEPVARLLGAGDSMMGNILIYGRIAICFVTAFMLQSVFHSFLIAAEKPKLGLLVTVIAGVTNMILDAVFIIVFKWGVAGAAIATGLSECVGGVLPLIYFLRKNDSLLRFTNTKLEFKPILKACTNGASELMSNISSSIVGMLYIMQLKRYIGDNGVAAYGVLMSANFIFIAIYIGYSIGSAPIVGFNHGAKNYDELKNMLKKSIVLMCGGGITLFLISQILASPIAMLFVGYDKELFELTKYAFRIYSLLFITAGFSIYVSSFFTALNNGAVSAAISFLRTLVFQTGAVIILPLFFGGGGIWWAVTIAEICATITSVSFIFAMKNRYHYM